MPNCTLLCKIAAVEIRRKISVGKCFPSEISVQTRQFSVPQNRRRRPGRAFRGADWHLPRHCSALSTLRGVGCGIFMDSGRFVGGGGIVTQLDISLMSNLTWMRRRGVNPTLASMIMIWNFGPHTAKAARDAVGLFRKRPPNV